LIAEILTRQGTPGRIRESSQSTTLGARLPSKWVARKRNADSSTGFAQNVVSITSPTESFEIFNLSAIAAPV
jgi:hypothetical protein